MSLDGSKRLWASWLLRTTLSAFARIAQAHDRDRHLRDAQFAEDTQSRMTSDDMTRQLIPDQRFDQPELGQTGLQFAIGGRCRRQDARRGL